MHCAYAIHIHVHTVKLRLHAIQLNISYVGLVQRLPAFEERAPGAMVMKAAVGVPCDKSSGVCCREGGALMQGYLTYKKTHPDRTLL